MNKQTFQIALLKKGVPACALSKVLGIDRATISRIVNGWITPTEKQKKEICKYLGVSVDEIFTEDSGAEND